MCRVLLMNKQGEKEIENIYGLDKYLKYLEKQMGGHGNGFALMKDGKVTKLEKGVNLDVRDIANVFRKTDYDWAIFHTRLASIGTISDSNCQDMFSLFLFCGLFSRSISAFSRRTSCDTPEAGNGWV